MKWLKNIVFKYAPKQFINWVQVQKKKRRKLILNKQAKLGGIDKEQLRTELKKIGIRKDDVVLVHSALSKIGFVKNGPKDLVDALLESVGDNGHILMPNSPNNQLQLDYIQNLEVFDVKQSVSKLGAVTEYFRCLPEAKRSWHPTEPVSCIGPDADYFVSEHFGELTPYTDKSPFYRVAQRNGKILMIGVTLDNAGTNLHCLEDAVESFKFPIYHEEVFDVLLLDEHGDMHTVKTKVHNPVWSAKRKCDELIPMFIEKGVLTEGKIGEAKTLLFDAHLMLQVMIDQYKTKGITMYTPFGS